MIIMTLVVIIIRRRRRNFPGLSISCHKQVADHCREGDAKQHTTKITLNDNKNKKLKESR